MYIQTELLHGRILLSERLTWRHVIPIRAEAKAVLLTWALVLGETYVFVWQSCIWFILLVVNVFIKSALSKYSHRLLALVHRIKV
mmetsp:Transcript_24814/g.18765  ORF Transcript_24814/g.18765 Transcript_24814/m.18765 type:complete len:85 (+) Transcript_24814:115-369(+)